MANEFTVSSLIEAVRQTGLLPSAEPTATAPKLIAIMNREQRGYLMRLLLSVRESHRVVRYETPVVGGKVSYSIPSRAVSAGLVSVELIEGNGIRLLIEVPREKRHQYRLHTIGGDYYVEGNEIFPVDTAVWGGTLRINYNRRFGKLVPEEEVGEITAIAGDAVTISLTPVAFTTAQTFDLVSGSPHFDTLAMDLTATSIASNVVTFATGTVPTTLAIGDFVCLAKQTPICQAPLELHDVLVQRAVVKHLEARGDSSLGAAQSALNEMKDDALCLLSPRSQDDNQRLINYNAPGATEAGGFSNASGQGAADQGPGHRRQPTLGSARRSHGSGRQRRDQLKGRSRESQRTGQANVQLRIRLL